MELSHPEFKEFRRREVNKAAALQKAAEEAERKARLYKSQGSIAEALFKQIEACSHKTWQEASFENLLIETLGMLGGY